MDARLVDSEARCLIPVREILDSVLADCRPHALALGGAVGSTGCRGSQPQTAPRVSAKSWRSPPAAMSLRRASLTVFWRPIGVPKARARILDTHQHRQKGAAYVPLARILRLPHPHERRPLQGDELVGQLMTAAVRIDNWQIHYLEAGCEGPGWLTYVLGRPTLKIDNLPIANSWLPMLEAARLGSETKGEAAPTDGNRRSPYAAASVSGSQPSPATSSRRPVRYSAWRGRTRTPHSELHASWPARWPRR
jgi:hypothetical protein